MKNQNNVLNTVKRISTIALLLTVIAQIVTIILLETGFKNPEVEELHEICGFLFFGFVLLHIILFRKSLKNMF
jgi:hypothetical protein